MRLKLELQFARDSSTTLPKNDPIFKMMITQPNKRRRDKTADEFGESLMIFLGKKTDQEMMDYSVFKSTIEKFTA